MEELAEYARSNRIAPEPSKTQLLVSAPAAKLKGLRKLACEMSGSPGRRTRASSKGCWPVGRPRLAIGGKAFGVWGLEVLNAVASGAVFAEQGEPEGSAPEEAP
eukprot:gene4125-7973_t